MLCDIAFSAAEHNRALYSLTVNVYASLGHA